MHLWNWLHLFAVSSKSNVNLWLQATLFFTLSIFPWSPCPGVLLVTMVTRGCLAVAVRSVSVPCGGRSLDHVTLSPANAVAGSGHLGGRVTSAWRSMCVDRLGSSVRLTHSFLFSIIHGTLFFFCILFFFLSFFLFSLAFSSSRVSAGCNIWYRRCRFN